MRYKDGQGVDKVLELGPDPVIIGRIPDCDVVMNDERVSRHHCEIKLWDRVHVIKDLDSHNGTLINGSAIEVAMLKPGDEINVGGAIIVVAEHNVGDGYRSVLSEIVLGIEQDTARRFSGL